MAEVMRDPSRQQLPQRHWTEARMFAGQVELRIAEVPGLQDAQVGSTQGGEFLEQRFQGARRISLAVTKPVVGLEEPVRALGQDDTRPRHPTGLRAVDQITD